MKTIKVFGLFLVCLFGMQNMAHAQRGIGCNVDSTCTGTFANVCPSTFAPATAGVFYSQQITFYFPDSTSFTVPSWVPILGGQVVQARVNSVEVSINDLPTGLNYSCNNANCTFTVTGAGGSRYGCAVVYGTPCDPSGNYDVEVEFNANISVASFPFSVPIPIPVEMDIQGNLPQLNITSITNYLCPTGPGSTIDLEASAGFVSYLWSNGDADSLTTVNAVGEYFVSATHGNGCTLSDSIEIVNLNATASNDTVICANTFFELSASGGDVFSWSPSALVSDRFVNDPLILRGLTADQTFQVVVSNGFCSDTATVEITIDNTCGLGICSRCTLDTVGCGGTMPAVCQQLPTAIAGEAYEESFSFYFPGVFDLKAMLPQSVKDLIQSQGGVIGIDTNDLPAFPVNEFYIELADLPQGFSWESDQSGNGNFYFPNKHASAQFGCVTLCGNSCDVAGEYLDFMIFAEAPSNILNILNLIGPFLGGSLPISVQGNYLGIPVPITSLTFEYETPLAITPSGSTAIEEGDTLTLTANGGFTDYVWSTGETSASIEVTEPGTYTLSATDANGCEQVQEIEVTLFNSVADLGAFEKSLNIFPNPNAGSFNVNFTLKDNQNVTVEVINLQGQVVNTLNLNGQTGSNVLPVSTNVSSGIYFVKIQTVDGSVTRRVSVN